MPVSLSGVMLGEKIEPKGRLKARPPANGTPPLAVWQAWQSAARARYWPRAMGSLDVKSGGTAGGGGPFVAAQPPRRAAGEGQRPGAGDEPGQDAQADDDHHSHDDQQ